MGEANESCYFNLKAMLYVEYKKDNDKVHKSQYPFFFFFNFNSNLQYRPDDWGENRGH
jgi:hypothetical protein